jgi:hypothetical protein
MGEFSHPDILAYSTTSVLQRQYMQLTESHRNQYITACRDSVAHLGQATLGAVEAMQVGLFNNEQQRVML